MTKHLNFIQFAILWNSKSTVTEQNKELNKTKKRRKMKSPEEKKCFNLLLGEISTEISFLAKLTKQL